MLVDIKLSSSPLNPILSLIASINNRSTDITKIATGMYECGHWNFSDVISEPVEEYPEISLPDGWFSPYGVCDEPKQLLEKFPDLVNSSRRFVIAFSPVRRADQSPEGGWRWHKWGPYIGNKTPQYEYLYDEKDIVEVYTYHVYELTKAKAHEKSDKVLN